MAEETLQIVVDSDGARRGIDRLADGLNRMFRAASQAEGGTDRLFNRLNNGFKSIETNVLNLRNVILGFGSIIGIFKELSDAIARFQGFISTMSVTAGSAAAARREFNFLGEMANRLGVYVGDLTRNYAQLSAAVAGTNISQATLQRTFESFAIASRTLHLSGHDTNLMFYAITQMVSKGAVSMEELRRQLGEKLPGAMGIAARSVNATVSELEGAIRKGVVDATKFVPIFAEAVRQTFGGGLANASQALDAEFNRLKNTLQQMIVTFYDLHVANSFTGIIKELNRVLADKQVAELFADVLKRISEQLTSFLRGITADDIRNWVKSFTTGLAELSGFITRDVLPVLKMLADNFRIIIEGWAIVKGVTIGAAIGGPIGAVVGGGTAVGGVMAGRGMFGNEGIGMPTRGVGAQGVHQHPDYHKGATSSGTDAKALAAQVQNDLDRVNAWSHTLTAMGFGMDANLRQKIIAASDTEMVRLVKDLDWSNKKAVDAAARNMIALLYNNPNSAAKLSDVLMTAKPKAGAGSKADPMRVMLDSLEQRLVGTGPEGNSYAAMRQKLDDIMAKGKGTMSLAPQIREAIDQLEARGNEYLPLISRLEGQLDRGNQNAPEILARALADLEIKFPGANQNVKDRASNLLERYQAQYEGAKMVREAKDRNSVTLARQGLSNDMYSSYMDFAQESDTFTTQLRNLDQLGLVREQETKRLEMQKRLNEDIIRLRERAISIGDDTFDAEKFRANQEKAIDAAIASLQRLQEYQRSVQFGINTAVNTYFEGISNSAAGVNSLLSGLFQNLEDTITDFVMTGEMNFERLATSFIQQLTRMYVQQQIMMPLIGTAQNPGFLTQAMNTFLPTALNWFGIGGGSDAGAMRGLSSGGGLGLQSSGVLAPGLDLPGLAEGGITNGPSIAGEGRYREAVVPLPDGRTIQGRMIDSSSPSIEVHIHEAPGTRASVSQRPDGGIDVMIEQMEDALSDRMTRGVGRFTNTMERQYGLNRAAGSSR